MARLEQQEIALPAPKGRGQSAITDVKLEVEAGLEHLAESFNSEEARAELQSMVSGAYRVETGLG
jgi:hypothetical protein